jgi:hypothetical protein
VGVRVVTGAHFQRSPRDGDPKRYVRKIHFTGQRNQHGQCYVVRNCFFEPSSSAAWQWVEDCVERARTAFRWRKPVVISTHRMNFVGSLVRENRGRSLRMLRELLRRMIVEFPDIEFMTSAELGREILGDSAPPPISPLSPATSNDEFRPL